MLAVTSYLSTDIAAVAAAVDRSVGALPPDVVIAFSGASALLKRIARPAMFLLVLPVAMFLAANVRNPLLLIIPLASAGVRDDGPVVSRRFRPPIGPRQST